MLLYPGIGKNTESLSQEDETSEYADKFSGRLESAKFASPETNDMSLAADPNAADQPREAVSKSTTHGGGFADPTSFSSFVDGETTVLLERTAELLETTAELLERSAGDAKNPAKEVAAAVNGSAGSAVSAQRSTLGHTFRPFNDATHHNHDPMGVTLISDIPALPLSTRDERTGDTRPRTMLYASHMNNNNSGDSTEDSTGKTSSGTGDVARLSRVLATATFPTQDLLAAYNRALVGDTIYLTPSATVFTGEACDPSNVGASSLCMTKAMIIVCNVLTASDSCTLDGLNTGTNGRRVVHVKTGKVQETEFKLMTFTRGYVVRCKRGSTS
jgi:hypothetical protein